MIEREFGVLSFQLWAVVDKISTDMELNEVVERGHKDTGNYTRHDWNTCFNRHGVKVVEERTQEH